MYNITAIELIFQKVLFGNVAIPYQCLGNVLCGYVTQPGNIESKKELDDTYELGKSIK